MCNESTVRILNEKTRTELQAYQDLLELFELNMPQLCLCELCTHTLTLTIQSLLHELKVSKGFRLKKKLQRGFLAF